MLSTKRFSSFTLKQKHKVLAEILSKVYQEKFKISDYNVLAQVIKLAPIESNKHLLNERFHYHCKNASMTFNEALWPQKQTDSLTNEPFLPIDIYLSKLRSAHNVGSIIRTTEALRLGSIHACPDTPLLNHQKVNKTSMGTSHIVKLHQATPFTKLKRPFIALETTNTAQNLFTFSFPPTFTLFLGNEHVGLDSQTLNECDSCIKIPLVGQKNSLNVANAFAIAAGFIRSQNDENKN